MFNRTQYRMAKQKYLVTGAILILGISIAKPAFSEDKNTSKQSADEYVKKTITNIDEWHVLKNIYGWSIKYPKDWETWPEPDGSRSPEIHISGPKDQLRNGLPNGDILFESHLMPKGCCYKNEKYIKKTAKESALSFVNGLGRSGTLKEFLILNSRDVNYGGWNGYEVDFLEIEKINHRQSTPSVERYIELRDGNKIIHITIGEGNKNVYRSLNEWKYSKLFEEILSTLQFQKNSTEAK